MLVPLEELYNQLNYTRKANLLICQLGDEPIDVDINPYKMSEGEEEFKSEDITRWKAAMRKASHSMSSSVMLHTKCDCVKLIVLDNEEQLEGYTVNDRTFRYIGNKNHNGIRYLDELVEAV